MIESNAQNKSLVNHFLVGESSKRFFDLFANIIGYVNSFLTITYLSVFYFGLFQLILSFCSIMDGFIIDNFDGPIAIEMRQYFSRKLPEKAKRIFKEYVLSKIALALVISVLVFFGSSLIAKWYGKDISLLIKVSSLLLLFYTLESLAVIFLKSIYSLSQWSFAPVKEIVKLVLLGALIISGHFDLSSLVVAHTVSQGFAILFVIVFVIAKKYRQVFGSIKSYGHYLLFNLLRHYGQWVSLGYAFSRLTKNIMPWLIKFFVNVEAVAFYSLALNMVAIIEGLMPVAGVDRLFVIKMNYFKELGFIFRSSVKYIFWLGILMFIPGLLFIPWLIPKIFPNYAPAVPLFRLMFLALPIFGVYKILKSILLVLREYRVLTMRILNEVIVNTAGAAIFLPIFGILGAGFIYVIVYIERVWFFYSRLIREYPIFKIHPQDLFKINASDRRLFVKIFKMALSKIKLV